MEVSEEPTVIGPIPPEVKAGMRDTSHAGAPAAEVGTAVTLPLDDLDPNPFQPRTAMDGRALKDLVDAIRVQGLLQPISVRRVGQRYQVIAGHRRLAAFKQLRATLGDAYARIPAHWRKDVTDEDMAVFALMENIQRDDLPPLDAALALTRFQESRGLSTEALAKRMGLEPDRVKRLLRLARSPRVVQDACGAGVLVDVAGGGEGAKRERVRLDVMAALEFAKLHGHVARESTKKADDRVSRAIERALQGRWPLRRVQTFCKKAIAGEADVPTEAAAPAARPLFLDGDTLQVFRSRLGGATAEELGDLREVLTRLLAELPA
jgi:ParB/RepB/Spo0J family partition protein